MTGMDTVDGVNPAWRRNLFVCLAGSFTTIVAMTLLLPYLPLYVRELGISDPASMAEWSGIAYGATFFTAALTAPLWGALGDRYGRKPMLIRASLGMAVAMSLVGVVQSVWQLVALRLLTGLLGGYSSGSTVLVAAQTPKQRTGWALGMLSAGVMTGNVIGPLLGGVAPELVGIRATFLLAGATIFCAFLATAFLVKEDRPGRTTSTTTHAAEAATAPAQGAAAPAVGFATDIGTAGPATGTRAVGPATGTGTAGPATGTSAVGSSATAAAPTGPPAPGAAQPRRPSAWSRVRHPGRVVALLVTSMLLMFAIMSIEPIITVYVGALAPGSTAIAATAGVVMAAGALGTILSAPRLGRLADRAGFAPVICGCLLASAVLLALQATAVNNLELGILRFLMGLSLGGLLPAITAAIRHTVTPSAVGQILGYSISAQYVGQVTGPVVGGFVGGHLGMPAVFLVTSVIMVTGAVLTWLTRERAAGARCAR